MTMLKVWTDGCFDLFHFGHSNILRQARHLGDHLTVGVHSSDVINCHKGLPVMNDAERYFIVRACKWVDEVYTDAPFVTSYELVCSQGIGRVVHGSDSVHSADGTDCYSEVKRHGMFCEVERTRYISTTELVGRMLLRRRPGTSSEECNDADGSDNDRMRYLSTLLHAFSTDTCSTDIAGRHVAYIDGTFDMFHAGHASLLKHCKDAGMHTVIGLYSQHTSHQLKGASPIMSGIERELCVSACRYVDRIVRDAPLVPDRAFIRQHGIDVIVCGDGNMSNYHRVQGMVDMRTVKSEFSYLTSTSIIRRIIDNYYGYKERNDNRK